MTDFKQQYKNPRLGFGDAFQSRILRAYNRGKSRKEDRIRTFDKNRELKNVSMNPQPEDISVITDKRMQKLIKWREERDRRKKLEAAKKKPAFKVGVVHHSLCSPIIKNKIPTIVAKSSKIKSPNIVQKRITRATEKRLLAKETNNKLAKDNLKNAAFTSTSQSINIKKSTPHIKKSFAPINHVFRPPSRLQKMPLFGLVPMEKTPLEKGDFFIKDKLTEHALLDINNQILQVSLEKLDLPMLDTNDAITPLKTSSPKLSSPKSSNHRKSQKFNKSICDSDNATDLNTTITMRTSLDEQRIQKQDSLQEDNTDMKTSLSQRPISNDPSSDQKKYMEDLIVFSPYLTLSRGKKNARREQQQRLGIGYSPSDEIPTKDTVMKNLNISVEEEERTAQYFKILLNKETDRLKELCEKWLDIQLKNEISDDIKYEINQAVGQTNLLISKKFERFRNLVHDCETGRGKMLVTCRDLQGFWDVVYMEIRDCDSRFEKLEQCRNRGWQEEEYTAAKIAVKKRLPAKKRIISSKPSALRSLILANRKKKKETGTLNKEDLLLQDTSINKEDIIPSSNNRKSTIFKENSDTQHNKKSKSINFNEHKLTPARRECFKANSVHKFSNAVKKMRSPFTAMKISQMCKTPEIQLDDTILYVNSDQTPAKSILKKSEEIINKETRIKSAHKVNFDDQIALTEVPLDKETQIELNLAVVLNNIDNFHLDKINSPKNPNIERRLTFESDDSDDSKDWNEFAYKVKTQLKDKQNKSKSSSVHNTLDFNAHLLNERTPPGCAKKSDDVIVSSEKNLKKQVRRSLRYRNAEPVITSVSSVTPSKTNIETLTNSETISNAIALEQNYDSEVRILRNRIIMINDTPKMNRSKMMTPERSVSKKENKSPMKSVEKKRRSRKSVMFNEETCLACVERKPVLPMTPHLKRSSKSYSRRSRSKFISGEDLISWHTPEHLPNRITRSNK